MNSAIKPGGFSLPALILAVSLAMGACRGATEPEVRVGTHIWPGYETLFLAREKGVFKDAAIRLLELPAASESIRAFENGSVDAALLTADEVLRLAERKLEPRIILVMDFSHGGDAILARPEIRDLRELKGRSVGVEANALGAYVLSRALDSVGMKPSELRIVSLLTAETEAAYRSGRVDAVVTFEPHRTRVMAAGAHVLFDSSQIPSEIADVMVVRKEFMEKAPKGLAQLVAGHFRALGRLAVERDEAARIMAQREGISPAEFLDSLTRLRQPDREENRRLLGQEPSPLREALRRLQKEMREHGILQAEDDPSRLLDDRFVREEAP